MASGGLETSIFSSFLLVDKDIYVLIVLGSCKLYIEYYVVIETLFLEAV